MAAVTQTAAWGCPKLIRPAISPVKEAKAQAARDSLGLDQVCPAMHIPCRTYFYSSDEFSVETPRQARLAMFFERMTTAPAASNFEEAFGQIHDVLNGVEDEYSGVPYNPPTWQTDGRLYPPLLDSEKVLNPPRSNLRLFTTRAHHVYMGDNGAIEIWLKGKPVFKKPGADGILLENL